MKRPTSTIIAAGLYLVVLLPFLVLDYERRRGHPRSYLLEFRYTPLAGLIKDGLLNMAAFVPSGWLLYGAIRDVKLSTGARVCVVGAFSAVFSLAMETVQFFMPSRYSSVIDVLTDTAGAVLGALIAAAWCADKPV